jgi:hypothetical protein
MKGVIQQLEVEAAAVACSCQLVVLTDMWSGIGRGAYDAFGLQLRAACSVEVSG